VTDADAAFDVVIVGAGAAGLATAIALGRANRSARVCLVDGARQVGAKILVSGGGRCNVTNVEVTEADFSSGSPAIVRRLLRAWPATATVAWFADLGVRLEAEPLGKLFPTSGRARDVLSALLAEVGRLGVTLRAGTRIIGLRRTAGGFALDTADRPLDARAVVLATGGLSLPKTGSDGWGYQAACALGHTLVPTTPALAPLVLESAGPRAIHRRLSGVAQPVRLDLAVNGATSVRIAGALLWTHFGVSGPAALDVSRHWLRATLDARSAVLTASLCPEETLESLDRRWTDLARTRPRASVASVTAGFGPSSVGTAIVEALGLPATQTLATLGRDDRRRLVRAFTAWPLAVTDSRGYTYAEVTAGGVPLGEIHPATMESRCVPGLYLVGEMLDVDGRIGGFNFQWAWATGHVAGAALASRVAPVHH
jgi:predicted Rossmann fold flavoprotein